jgi:hypothetical protein
MASNESTASQNHHGITALIELYKENTAHGRHTESQRQLVTTILVTFVGAILGLLGTRSFDIYLLPLAVFIIPVGVFGKAIVAKLKERFEYHMAMAKAFRTEIETQCPSARISERRQEAKERHKKEFTDCELLA